MSCIDLDLPPFTLPSIFAGPPVIPPIPFPVGADFCCKFQINDPGFNAAIAAANLAIAAAFPSAALMFMAAALVEVMSVANLALSALKDLSVECPLDHSNLVV